MGYYLLSFPGTTDTLKILRMLLEKKKFHYKHLNLIFHHNLREMDFGLVSKFLPGTNIPLEVMLNRCKVCNNCFSFSRTERTSIVKSNS